jgi:uncharacterized protein
MTMRWGDFRRSENVEDRTEGMPEGSGGGSPIGGLHIGGGALIILVIVGMLFGINPLEMLGLLTGNDDTVQQSAPPARPGYGPQRGSAAPSSAAAVNKDFSRAVLGDTEDVWGAIFKAMGSRYAPPTLVLYRGVTRSACGRANAAVGPFYCPGDHDLYLDTSFFNELSTRFGAPGEFAQAYVIAHEVGHHVQTLLGTMDKVEPQMQRGGERTANGLSVRLELQADCYAGVWANRSNEKWKFIEPGDVEAAMQTAAAIGDDRLQKQTRGTVVPDSFTHGTSAQRQKWFSTGLKEGKVSACDTFAAGAGL